MDERTALAVLVIVIQLADAIFYHVPSSILVEPYGEEGYTDFGFSLAYSSKKLIVGAPRRSDQGNIYTCEIKEVSHAVKVQCDETLVDIDSLAEYDRTVNPNQYFYTGASIVATPTFILTCAPLWTSSIQAGKDRLSDAFGTCFTLNSTNTYRFEGTLERFLKEPSRITDLNAFEGGTGWSTLADKENDLLIVVKTSLYGDFMYTPLSNAQIPSQSVVLNEDSASMRSRRFLRDNHFNIGYGITAGKFFSKETTVYAFSMANEAMEGVISFLQYNRFNKVLSVKHYHRHPFEIGNKEVGAMFGTTLAAADLDMDGLDELLVGAPAHSEGGCVECGALHIYMGGSMDQIRNRNNLRTILGIADLGRFSTAIATKDIDGDSIPEIVVSAPYENEGLGAVYILSGYEIYHTLIKIQTYKKILISDLKMTQRIQKQAFKSLGFSLQFVNDIDYNGCRELAVGSPGNGNVLLFKCVQKINITMTNQLVGMQTVREQDMNFTVAVCAKVVLPDLPNFIIGNISVVSSIIGEASSIKEPEFNIDISCYDCKKERTICHNVSVTLGDKEERHYVFTSKAELYTKHILNNKSRVYNESWVEASPYSIMKDTIKVPRHCSGKDCYPNLSVKLQWSGRKEYLLGSSANETVTVLVRNSGKAAFDACVFVNVIGAPITRINCADMDNNIYKCSLPKPLKRDTEYPINLMLNMTKPTNLDGKILVGAMVNEFCRPKLKFNNDVTMNVTYVLPVGDIHTYRVSHIKNVTDRQIMNEVTVFGDHEYQIINNGSVTWKNVPCVLTVERNSTFPSLKVIMMDSLKCKDESTSTTIRFRCLVDLMPNSRQKVSAATEINASDLKIFLPNGKFNITSKFKLYLTNNNKTIEDSVFNEFELRKETTLGNNRWLIALIALIVALIILAILIFVLYKYGFFRRKQKQRLEVLKESIKRRDSRRATHTSDVVDGPDGPVEGLQMDVDDDDAFYTVPIAETTKDKANLVDK